jgi:hypothetical protein
VIRVPGDRLVAITNTCYILFLFLFLGKPMTVSILNPLLSLRGLKNVQYVQSVCLSVTPLRLGSVRSNIIITSFYHAMNFYLSLCSRTSFSLSVTHDAQSSMNHTRKYKGSICSLIVVVSFRSFVSFVRGSHVSNLLLKTQRSAWEGTRDNICSHCW